MGQQPPHMVILGCGYVGAAVATQARGRGWSVTALTRNPAAAAELRAGGIQTVVADLASDSWHAEIRVPIDFALVCVSAGGGGLDGYRHSYVDGLASVVRWAAGAGPIRTLAYTSSTSVYPQGDGAVVTEASTVSPRDDRAGLLIEAETRLLSPAPSPRRGYERAIVLRLAGIYGPGRHALLDQVRSGVVSGSGDHRLNLIHCDDIVAAVWAAFGAGLGIGDDVFNLADDAPARKSDVVTWLADRLHLPAPSFSGAPAAGRRMVTPDRIISNAKARRMLGWAPQFASFRHGYENILSPGPV